MLNEPYFSLVPKVPCEKKDAGVGTCVDLNGDSKPDTNLCKDNGSSLNGQISQHIPASPDGKISVTYAHEWPALDVILEKRNDISGLLEPATGKENVEKDCSQPLGKHLIKHPV